MFTDTKYTIRSENGYRYICRGSDRSRPTLVMLHGMFGGMSNFERLIEELEDSYQLLVPEIPLYQMEAEKLNIPSLSGWIHSFLEQMGVHSAVLLGNSMGGHIALEYARKFPRRVNAMVLSGSSGLFENEFGDSMPKRSDRSYIRERAELTFYDPAMVTDELIDDILEIVNDSSKLVRLLKLARATHAYNMEDQLPAIDIPTLLIWGVDDVITPPEVARTFKKQLPDAELHWIEECGHAPMMERPASFLSVLKPFLERCTTLEAKK